MTFALKVPGRLPPVNRAPAQDASVGDVLGAAWTSETIRDDVNAYGRQVETKIMHEIAGRLGPRVPAFAGAGLNHPLANRTNSPMSDWQRRELLNAAAEAERQNPAAWGDLPTSDAAVAAEGAHRRRAELDDAAATLQMGEGFFAAAAEFIGGAAATMSSVPQVPLMMLGGGAGGIARTVAIEAGLGAAGEAIALPARVRVAGELDLPDVTFGDAAMQVGAGAVFGGGIGGALWGAQRGAAYLAGRRGQVERSAPPGADIGDHGATIQQAEAALRGDEPIPEPAPITGRDGITRAAHKITAVESGGRADAQNPNSTARGRGQFIESTWLDVMRRHRPDLTQTRTEKQLLALRDDRAISDEMTKAYASDNAGRLEAEGYTTTEANIYLMHFLGPDGGVRALKSDPDAPITGVMSAKQIEANRGMTYAGRPIQHWTVRDLRRWTEVKMGMAADPGDAYSAATRRGYTTGTQVVTPAGTRVDVEYEVVDMDTLVLASGNRQPRDRSRAAPSAKVKDRAGALDPAQLMPGPYAGSGAPIVGGDHIIDSGNGRVMSLIHAAENFPDRFAAYVDAVRGAGFDVPAGIKRPVLIARRTTELDDEGLRRFVREANDDVVERMSPSEQARADADAVTDEALGLYDPEAGGIAAAANRHFVTKLVQGLPSSQQGSVMDQAGRLTPAGASRIQGALLARAFDAPDLVEAATEAAGAEVKSLVDALTDIAPAWAQMRAAIAAGTARADFDISAQVIEAVRMIRAARAQSVREGIPVHAALADLLAQDDIFAGGVDPVVARLVGLAYNGGRARSRDAVAGALRDYVAEARRIGDGGAGLLDAVAPVGPLDVLDTVRARMERDDVTAAGGALLAPDDAEARAAPASPAGLPVIDVEAAEPEKWSEGATSPAAIEAADQAEASLRQEFAAPAPAEPDAGVAALRAEGDFEIEPGLYASELLDDIDADREFTELVDICSYGGRANA